MTRFLADGVLQVDVMFLEINMEMYGNNVGALAYADVPIPRLLVTNLLWEVVSSLIFSSTTSGVVKLEDQKNNMWFLSSIYPLSQDGNRHHLGVLHMLHV